MVGARTSWMPIGEFSRRVGVSPDLLRKWERRYRVFTPARSPRGRRLYSRTDQARAEYMIRRVRAGLPAAQAAQIALAAGFKAAPRSSAAKSTHDGVATSTTAASFESSLVPMLVADDRRRYVDANRAACLLLRV